MQAYQFDAPNLATLKRVQIETPQPGPGEVLVRLRAASLNYLDLVVAQGAFGSDAFPLIPVCDGAGEIEELGAGVDGWKVGEKVIPHLMIDWAGGTITAPAVKRLRGVTMPGSAAEYAVMPAAGLAAMPAHLSFTEAATLPIAATTAWNALRTARIGPGSTVALLGTGGVSIFALQFAKASGARVLIISSSNEKLERARAIGADETINYRSVPAWDDEVLRLTGGVGADLVVETVGPATFPRSLNAAALGACVFVVGFVSGTETTIPILPISLKMLNIVGSNTGSVQTFRDAVRAVAAMRLKPAVDRAFGFNELAAAYAHLQSATHVGKVAIDLSTAT